MTRGWQAGWPGWQSGPPPEQYQPWWWGPGSQRPTPERPGRDVESPAPMRIGDAERDRAVSDLGDHFAAGRLTREEFDERADQAIQARFSTELEPLFADLPKAAPEQPHPGPGRIPGGPPPWAYAMWLLPFVLIAAVAGSILLHAPFLIWIAIWLIVIGRITGHRRRYRRQQAGRYGPFSPPGPR